MNLMQTGAAWLGAQLQVAAGRVVTIEQGTTTLADITGWISNHEYEVIDAEGFLTRVLSHDWSFVAADVGSLEFRPGALVVDGDEHYEAMAVGNRPCAERLDSSGVLLLLHTKRVKVDA